MLVLVVRVLFFLQDNFWKTTLFKLSHTKEIVIKLPPETNDSQSSTRWSCSGSLACYVLECGQLSLIPVEWRPDQDWIVRSTHPSYTCAVMTKQRVNRVTKHMVECTCRLFLTSPIPPDTTPRSVCWCSLGFEEYALSPRPRDECCSTLGRRSQRLTSPQRRITPFHHHVFFKSPAKQKNTHIPAYVEHAYTSE